MAVIRGNEVNKKLLAILGVLVLLLITGCKTTTDKEDINSFIFEDEYEVIIGQDDYTLKGFVGETPLNLKLKADPRDIKDIFSEKDIKTKLLPASLIFITLKPNLTSTAVVAATEISKITAHQSLFRTKTLGALTEKSNNEAAPVITCADATIEQKVIYLKLSDTTKISSLNNCITIEGKTEQDLVRAADKLILQLLGIL